MKHGEVHLEMRTLIPTVLRMFTRPFVMLGMLCYGIGTAVWVVVLSKLELSYAYPFISLSYVLVALASYVVFKEKISKMRWLSIVIIMLGVSLVSLS